MIVGPQAGLAAIAGPSALIAAVATVVGAVTLMVFFAKGGWWGLANDIASVVMMLATIPVALFLANFTGGLVGQVVAGAILLVGLVGMVGTSITQGLLIARVRSYEFLLPWTLGLGAVVGLWYLGVGVTGYLAGMPFLMAALAILSGIGFVAIGYGFWRSGQQSRIALGGGVVLLFASTTFFVWIGLAAIAAAALNR
jgi:hypothetical protein